MDHCPYTMRSVLNIVHKSLHPSMKYFILGFEHAIPVFHTSFKPLWQYCRRCHSGWDLHCFDVLHARMNTESTFTLQVQWKFPRMITWAYYLRFWDYDHLIKKLPLSGLQLLTSGSLKMSYNQLIKAVHYFDMSCRNMHKYLKMYKFMTK